MSDGLVVISSCSATKLHTPDGSSRTAESLYTGQQHVRLMRGVRAYRAAGQPVGTLRFRILSAFYGLLPPKRQISSYDHTFAGLPVEAIRREARERRVPAETRRLLAQPFTAGVLLLGDPYIHACDLDEHVKLGGPVICFCSPAVARRLPRLAGLRTVALTNDEARRFSVGLVALKGELGGRLLTRLAEEPGDLERLTAADTDMLGWLEGARASRPEAAAA